jgi:hypothetical protein
MQLNLGIVQTKFLYAWVPNVSKFQKFKYIYSLT